MYHLTKIVHVLLILFVTVACALTPSVAPTPISNKIILLYPDDSTKVELKRDGWNQYTSVSFGTSLHPSDLIRSDGPGFILCADLTVYPIPARGRPPCENEQGWLEYNEYQFSSGPRGPASNIPYIIFPRSTAVLNPNPVLRWHNTGASSYSVAITRNGEIIWGNNNVIGNHIEYPTSAQKLMPGEEYLLTVKDNDTDVSSQEDPAKGLGFEILDDESVEFVNQRRDEILNQNLISEPAKKLTLAIFYTNLDFEGKRKLWGEAWLLLDDIAQVKRAPAVYLQTGNLLLAMKLKDESEMAYNEALQLAEMVGDIETQAAANVGLWHATGEEEFKIEAIRFYKILGDEAMGQKVKDDQ